MKRADQGLAFMLQYENVAWYSDGAVRILDRRIYPVRTEYVTCRHHTEVAAAIRDMVTQSGGPYTAAAMGMALAAYEARDKTGTALLEYLEQAAYTLSHARPTTAEKMARVVEGSLAAARKAVEAGMKVDEALFEHAIEFLNSRYNKTAEIAKYLVDKFPDNGTVMTQCFAETIVGTMLRECRERGKEIKVICPETRPYFQGARLTASVVCDQGFDVTLITDNMPGYVLKEKNVDVFTSAADVICVDGHIVNKVGTFQIALAAHYWGIPYFVTGAPNAEHPTIDTVRIEERDGDFVLQAMGVQTTMAGVKGYYPAFDITPPKLCAGVVTEKGIFAPYALESYFRK
ncbi:MAG: S-methyl-5-thioribose-1-phosphate isomerase [bacterium]